MDYQASVAAASAACSSLESLPAVHVSPFDSSLFYGFNRSGPCGKVTGPPRPSSVAQHPLDLQQQQELNMFEQQQLKRAACIYGGHAWSRLKTEREFCAMTQRLPGIRSSMLGLETVMGLDDYIAVFDYMGRERPLTEGGPMLSVHDLIERTMGI